MNNQKPKSKTPLIFLVIFCTIILLLAWFVNRINNHTKSQILSNLELELTRLEEDFVHRMNYTLLIIQNINLHIAKNHTNTNHINQVLKFYHNHQVLIKSLSWESTSWVNDDFKIIVNSNNGVFKKPHNISFRSYILMTEIKPNTLQLESPIIGIATGKKFIPGGVGLADKNGKYLGATIIGFDIKLLAKLLQKALKTSKVKFSLFGKNEVPILYGDYKSYGIYDSNDNANSIKINKITNQFYSKNNNKIYSIALFKSHHAYLAKRINGYPYTLFLEYKEEEISKELFDITISHLPEILPLLFGLITLLILVYYEKQRTQTILYLQQSAEQANKAKSKFLIKTTHKFKNFIFGIQGCAEIIKNDLKKLTEKSKKNAYLEILESNLDLSYNIIETSRNLDNFLNYLIDIDYNENYYSNYKKSNRLIDISKIIKQSITNTKAHAKSSNIIIIPEISKDLHNISGFNSSHVKQIITNLINNAIRHSPRASIVKITAQNVSDKDEITKLYNSYGIRKSNIVEILIEDQRLETIEYKANHKMPKYNKDNKILTFNLPALKFLIESQGGILELRSAKGQGNKIRIIL